MDGLGSVVMEMEMRVLWHRRGGARKHSMGVAGRALAFGIFCIWAEISLDGSSRRGDKSRIKIQLLEGVRVHGTPSRINGEPQRLVDYRTRRGEKYRVHRTVL